MRRILSVLFLMSLAFVVWAGNTIVTVEQVVSDVTLSDDVDYVITGAEPFASGVKVDITNLDHAVIIVREVRPSKVISSLLSSHVLINGQRAVNGSNCQVKMYAQGAIILPYPAGFKPLTVYSEQNFGGASVDDFGLEHDGGFMNTLTDAKLNNQIRSFRLKRGYMVTFSTRAGGRGYSRCFIADSEDLEVSTLPVVLDGKITSYRIFQWYDAQKKGLASDTREYENSLITSAWCYDWGTGVNRLPDVECVPNHIYEDWPSASACGSVTYSCHMKTNNEPGNSADDHPQDVATVLANWENLMRTGMRLCSESSHDGSWGHLRAFIDSIDARGWRCDLLDLHCYWANGFDNMQYYYNTYGHRPIWISEWVWGASWNNNGIFSGDRSYSIENQQRNANKLKEIIPQLNQSPYVERYAYWNSEADCSKIIKDGQLSLAGEYYAATNSGLGYNRQYEKIPTNPRQYNPGNLTATYDKTSRQVTLRWRDYNGEYNRSMTVMSQKSGSNSWTTEMSVTPQEVEADYEVVVDGRDGYRYRVDVVDLNGRTRQTNEATAVNDNLEPGDDVSMSADEVLYLGGNRLLNGNFDFGLNEWLNGAGEPLSSPYFQVLPCGGIDGGSYLQCYGHSTNVTDQASLRMVFDVNEGESYYVAAAGCNNDPATQRISTTFSEDIELNVRIRMPKVSEWARQGKSFTVGADDRLMIQMRGLGGIAQFDEVKVCRLFPTREEALADALVWARERASAFARYNTSLPLLNDELLAFAEASSSALDIEAHICRSLQALRAYAQTDSLLSDARLVSMLGFNPEVSGLISQFASAQTAEGIITCSLLLSDAVRDALQFVPDASPISSPSFDSSDGWNTRCGTYTAGDQRLATQAGRSCWNAWWNISAATGSASTMAISQQVSGIEHGLYALECKALTQHLCETDQHSYLVVNDDTLSSPVLPLGVLDLPSFSDAQKWQTLVTPYVYVSDDAPVQIGFIGSKDGAQDHLWHPYADPANNGDNREGWWCATDFTLRRVPMFMRQADVEGWGTVCLPYNIEVPAGVELYQLAGILDTHAAICLEPVSGVAEAGVPYVFHGSEAQMTAFREYGDKVSRAQTNVNGLRGTFATGAKYPVGSLVLTDGEWRYIPDADSRYPIVPFSGYIYKLSDVPELSSWSGLTLPTQGVEILSGISTLHTDVPASFPIYNAAGILVDESYRGIVIRNGIRQILK